MRPETPLALAWQLPILMLMAGTLLPDIPWRHAGIGLWPLWLLAMALPAGIRYHITMRRVVRHRVSQVLVFPTAALTSIAPRSAPRKAA